MVEEGSHWLKITKMSHQNFSILALFYQIFVQFKLACLVPLFDGKLQIFEKIAKLTIFDIFNELLSTLNVNVACWMRLFLRFSNTVGFARKKCTTTLKRNGTPRRSFYLRVIQLWFVARWMVFLQTNHKHWGKKCF